MTHRGLTCILAIAALSGCAAPSPQALARMERIQVFQENDPKLTCQEIRTELASLDLDVIWLDKQIELNTPRGTSSMLHPVLMPIGMMAEKEGAIRADKMRASRDSRQQRRDTLMRQFYALKC